MFLMNQTDQERRPERTKGLAEGAERVGGLETQESLNLTVRNVPVKQQYIDSQVNTPMVVLDWSLSASEVVSIRYRGSNWFVPPIRSQHGF